MKIQFTFFIFLLLFQIDLLGQILWQKHFETIDMNVLSIQTLSGGKAFNMVGVKDGHLHSIGLNSKHEIINNSTFDRKNQLHPKVLYTSNGKNYLTLSQEKGQLKYGLINLTGRQIWEHSFDFNGKIYAACSNKDNQIIIVGQKDDRMFIAKLSQDGQLIWEKLFGSGALLDVELTIDGGFIVAGYIDMYFSAETDFIILQLDAEGKNKWERAFGEPDKVEKAHLVTITSNNQIVVVGQRGNSLWILQLNNQQEVEWEEVINHEYINFLPTSICETSNGQTIFTAVAQRENTDNHLFVVKLNNSFGEVGVKTKIEFSLLSISLEQEQETLNFERKGNVYQQKIAASLPHKYIEIYGQKTDIYSIDIIYFDKNHKASFSPILSTNYLENDTQILTKLTDLSNNILIIVVSNQALDKKKIQRKLSYKKFSKTNIEDVFLVKNLNDQTVNFEENNLCAWTTFENPKTIIFVLSLK